MNKRWAQAFGFAVPLVGSYLLFGFLTIWIRFSVQVTEGREWEGREWEGVTYIVFFITAALVALSSFLTASLALRLRSGLALRMGLLRAGFAGLAAALLLWAGPGEWVLHTLDGLPQRLGVDGTVIAFGSSALTVVTASTLSMILAWALPPWKNRVQSAA